MWVEIMLGAGALLSLSLNVLLIWYIRVVLRRLSWFQEEVGGVSFELREYGKWCKELSRSEATRRDPVFVDFYQQTKSMVDRLEQFQDGFVISELNEEFEEELESDVEEDINE